MIADLPAGAQVVPQHVAAAVEQGEPLALVPGDHPGEDEAVHVLEGAQELRATGERVGVEEAADVRAQHERVVDDAARDEGRPQEPPEAVALEGAVVEVAQ